MKTKLLTKLICLFMPFILITGCSNSNANVAKVSDRQQVIYMGAGTSYNGKYYYGYSNGTFALKVFDEATKKTEYLCKKTSCLHDEEDKTCSSYCRDISAYLPVGEYLYVFMQKYGIEQLGNIDRISLETGLRERYIDLCDFGYIYNAYLVADNIYFSDQNYYTVPADTYELTDTSHQISTIKVLDIENKTIEIIANGEKNKRIFPYISAIEGSTLYYQEYRQYSGSDMTKYKASLRPKNKQRHPYNGIDWVGTPGFFYYNVDWISLFTYDLTTKETVNTVNGIENYGQNYYDNGFYFLDEQNNTHRVDWLTGDDKVVISADKAQFAAAEVCELSSYVYDETFSYTTFSVTLRESSKDRHDKAYDRTVTGRRIYDAKSDTIKTHDFDDNALQYMTIADELNDGYIVAYKTNIVKQFKYGYITKHDYFAGKANFF